MSFTRNNSFVFGPFHYDPEKRVLSLWREGDAVPINPKPAELLEILLRTPSGKPTADIATALGLEKSASAIRHRISELRHCMNLLQLGSGDRYLLSGPYRLVDSAEEDLPDPIGANSAESPFVGIQSFKEEHGAFYFGRKVERARLVRFFTLSTPACPVVVLSAPSGAGKSSLINATLQKDLDEVAESEGGGTFRIAGITNCTLAADAPGEHLYTSAALQQLKSTATEWEGYLSNLANATGKVPSTWVLVIDQLEDILIHGFAEKIRDQFFDDLNTALHNHPALRLLLVVREEYWPELERSYAQVLAKRMIGRATLNPFRRGDAFLTMNQIALAGGASFDADLLDPMLDYLSRERYRKPRSPSTTEEPVEWIIAQSDRIEPIHLQVIGVEIWNHVLPDQKRIGIDTLQRALPDVATDSGQLIETFVERCLEGYVSKAIQRVAGGKPPVRAELLQVGLADFVHGLQRRPILESSDGYVGHLPGHIVRAFQREDARLLSRFHSSSGYEYYELSHQRLVESILNERTKVGPAHLERMWTAALEDLPQSEQSPDQVVRSIFEMIDGAGSPRLLAGTECGLPRSVKSYLIENSLIRERVAGVEISHPEFARALYHLKRIEEDRDRGPIALVRNVFASNVAVFATLIVTANGRGFLAQYAATLNSRPGFFWVGWFQGIVGGLVWGGFIGPVVSHYLVRRQVIMAGGGHGVPTLPQVAVAGAFVGLLGGWIVTLAIVFGQHAYSLEGTRWIPEGGSKADAFRFSALPLAEPWFGLILGLVCSVVVWRQATSPDWAHFLSKNPLPRTLGSAAGVFLRLGRLVLPGSLLLALSTTLAAILYINFGDLLFPSNPPLPCPTFGEAVIIAIGGSAIIFGVLLGQMAVYWAMSPIPKLEKRRGPDTDDGSHSSL